MHTTCCRNNLPLPNSKKKKNHNGKSQHEHCCRHVHVHVYCSIIIAQNYTNNYVKDVKIYCVIMSTISAAFAVDLYSPQPFHTPSYQLGGSTAREDYPPETLCTRDNIESLFPQETCTPGAYPLISFLCYNTHALWINRKLYNSEKFK
jgi:hypothetical protein